MQEYFDRDKFEDTVITHELNDMVQKAASEYRKKSKEKDEEKEVRQSCSELLRDSYQVYQRKTTRQLNTAFFGFRKEQRGGVNRQRGVRGKGMEKKCW